MKAQQAGRALRSSPTRNKRHTTARAEPFDRAPEQINLHQLTEAESAEEVGEHSK